MFSVTALKSLRELIESLKKYNRYDLQDEHNKSLINKVYVDPLPNDGVLNLGLADNDCFFIGRKGTGKSTVFLMAQNAIRKSSDKLAIYLDVKSLYGQSKLTRLEGKKYCDAIGTEGLESISNYLILKSFISLFLDETIVELQDHLVLGLRERIFSNREQKIETALHELKDLSKQVVESDTYRDIPIFLETKFAEKEAAKNKRERGRSAQIDGQGSASLAQFTAKLGFGINAKSTNTSSEEFSSETQREFKDILTLYFNIDSLLKSINAILKKAGFNKLFLFLDDFSEVDDELAAKMIVDILISPLIKSSSDFYRLKIAAYPDRVYFGDIDKQKIDEISLDFYDMYASKKLSDLEQKAIDFTRRIIDRRSEVYLGRDFLEYVDTPFKQTFYEELFKATMNNPRRMGYLLLYCYHSRIVHDQKITITAFREAAITLYEEKDDAIFKDNIKIQQAFGERLMIQSQQELLYTIKERARELAKDLPKSGSKFFQALPQIYTSHFYLHEPFEFVLRTLEHNFLISKYHELKDRDGKEITIYSLNYGLCLKEGIHFGRPEKSEEGKYLTERTFNYLSIIQDFLKKFIKIQCPACDEVHPTEQLQALKLYDMMCPKCRNGICELTLGYEEIVEEINRRFRDIQLPEIEFEILKIVYEEQDRDSYASAVAAEIDRSYQFVTSHTERLYKMGLLEKQRKNVGDQERVVYCLNKTALEIYFS